MKHPVKPEPPITWEELNRMTMQRLGWINVGRALEQGMKQSDGIGGGSWREVR